ncbi:MAG: ADP-ribosyltransferase, partial [Oscillospiraceae bacterium]
MQKTPNAPLQLLVSQICIENLVSTEMWYDTADEALEYVIADVRLLQRAKWALDENELTVLKERAEYFGLDKTESFKDFEEKYIKRLVADEEKSAIETYAGAYSYKINDKLRAGAKLSKEDDNFIQSFDSALDKLPTYEGVVYRSVDVTFMRNELE